MEGVDSGFSIEGGGGGGGGVAWALTKLLIDVTLDSRAEMVLCAVACCAWNEFKSSTADSSLFDNVVSLSKSSSMTEHGLGEFSRRSSLSPSP